jgi:hypothetical protein
MHPDPTTSHERLPDECRLHAHGLNHVQPGNGLAGIGRNAAFVDIGTYCGMLQADGTAGDEPITGENPDMRNTAENPSAVDQVTGTRNSIAPDFNNPCPAYSHTYTIPSIATMPNQPPP